MKDEKYSQWKSVVEIFEEQVENDPHKCALQISDQSENFERFLYYELNLYANQIAHHLLDKGLKPQSLIGVHLNKGFDLYASLLAIWKIGAVYVPLSYSLSMINLELRIKDSGVTTILSNKFLMSKFPENFFVQNKVTTIDLIKVNKDALEVSNPVVEKKPNDLAYIIYTSGTTGQPKGIAIMHEGIPECWSSHQELMQLDEKDRVFQLADIAVDVHIMEVILAFCSGASLCISQLAPEKLIYELPRTFELNNITAAIMPPTLLNGLIANLDPKNVKELLNKEFKSLRHLISATEEVNEQTLSMWFDRGTDEKRFLYNGYGSTEETVGVTIARYKGGTPSIGNFSNAFKGKEIFLLRDEKLTKEGKGELCVAGRGLALGYWKNGKIDSEKTNQHFIFINIDQKDNSRIRIYKTGDLVEIHNNEIFFISRIMQDRQVEIGGNRIELEGIEKKLELHPDVKKAFVIKKDQRLNAFIIPAIDKIISLDSLRKQIDTKEDSRSAEMPFAFFQINEGNLEQIKKNQWSDTDFKRIMPVENKHFGPKYIIEEQIQAIWKSLFSLNDINFTSDFYSLGGYSLLLNRMLSIIRKTFQEDFTTNDLPKLITIRSLARFIFMQKIYDKCYLSIQKIDKEKPLLVLLPPLAGGTTKKYKALSKNLDQNLNVATIKSPFLNSKSIDEKDLKCFEELIKPDLEEMGNFIARTLIKNKPTGSFLIAGWSFGGLLALEVTRNLVSKNREVIFTGLIDTQAPTILKKMDQSITAERLIHIIQLIAKECGCDFAAKGLIEFLETKQEFEVAVAKIFNTIFVNIEQEKAVLNNNQSINNIKRFEAMMITAKINYLATYGYDPQGNIPPLCIFYASEPIEGNRFEYKPEDLKSLTREITERKISKTNHFTILENQDFVKEFKKSINNALQLKISLQEIIHKIYSKFLIAEEENSNTTNSKVDVLINTSSKVKIPLGYVVNSFLKNPEKQILFLTGGSGLGKSHALRNIELTFWHRYHHERGLKIPLKINRANIRSNNFENLVNKTFRYYGLNDEKIVFLKGVGVEFLFMLDDLHLIPDFKITDEVVSKKLKSYHAKLFITCSTAYFFVDKQGLFSSLKTNSELVKRNQIFYLAALSKKQKSDYLNTLDSKSNTLQYSLLDHERLSSLVDHPRMFNHLFSAISVELNRCKESPIVINIFSNFIDIILTREEQILSAENDNTENIKNLLYNFYKSLAFLLFTNQKTEFELIRKPNEEDFIRTLLADLKGINDHKPEAKENKRQDKSILQLIVNEKIFPFNIDSTIRRSDLINCTTKKSFQIEPQIYNYFLALTLFESILNGFKIINEITQESITITPNFFKKIGDASYFLDQLIESHQKKISSAFDNYIEINRREKSEITINAASCALTLLNKYRFLEPSLAKRDLTKLKIERAILTNAVLYQTDFSESILTDVDFRGSFLGETIFYKTVLNNPAINALPYQEFKQPIKALAFSSNKKKMAVLYENNTTVWLLKTRNLIKTFSVPFDATSLCFDSDGKTLAVGGINNSDFYSFENDSYFTQKNNLFLVSTAYSKDLQYGFSITSKGGVIQWLSSNCNKIEFFDTQNHSATCLSVNENTLTAGFQNGYVIIWSLSNKTIQQVFKLGANAISTIKHSPNGKQIAIAFAAKIEIWLLEEKQLMTSFSLDDIRFNQLVYSDDSKRLAIAGSDFNIYEINPLNGKIYQCHRGHSNLIVNLSYCYDNKLIISASMDKSVRYWYVLSELSQEFFPEFFYEIVLVDTNSKKNQLFCLFSDYSSLIIDMSNGNVQYLPKESLPNDLNPMKVTYDQNHKIFNHLEPAPDFNKIPWLNKLWYQQNLTGPKSISLIDYTYRSSNDRVYFAVSHGGILRVWDLKKNELIYLCQKNFSKMAFHPSKGILTCSNGNALLEWSLETGQMIGFYCHNNERITAVDYNEDGNILVAGTSGGKIILWNTVDNKLIECLNGHESYISLVFLKNQQLISFAHDKSLNIWKLSESHNQYLLHFRFSNKFFCQRAQVFGAELSNNDHHVFKMFGANTNEKKPNEPITTNNTLKTHLFRPTDEKAQTLFDAKLENPPLNFQLTLWGKPLDDSGSSNHSTNESLSLTN